MVMTRGICAETIWEIHFPMREIYENLWVLTNVISQKCKLIGFPSPSTITHQTRLIVCGIIDFEIKMAKQIDLVEAEFTPRREGSFLLEIHLPWGNGASFEKPLKQLFRTFEHSSRRWKVFWGAVTLKNIAKWREAFDLCGGTHPRCFSNMSQVSFSISDRSKAVDDEDGLFVFENPGSGWCDRRKRSFELPQPEKSRFSTRCEDEGEKQTKVSESAKLKIKK